MKALKKINCIIFYLFFMLMPAFTLSVTMTSCEKLFELIGGEEDDEDEDLDEMQMTIDGKEPYFKLLSEEVRIPQYMKDDYDKLVVEYETNLAQFCPFLIDSYMKMRDAQYYETVPYFIFKNMDYYASDYNRAEFDFYPNANDKEVRDTILVVNPFYSEEIIAKIPVVQEAGEWVRVVSYEATDNTLTLKLENSEKAVAYGYMVLTEKAPLSILQNEAHDNDYQAFRENEIHGLLGTEDKTLDLNVLWSERIYYIYIAAMDENGRFTGITEFEAKSAPEK